MAQTEHSLPALADSDADDVVLALQTSHALWRQGDLHEAVRWLRRAAAAAADCGDDTRSFSLAAAAADLTTELNVPRSIVPGVSQSNGHHPSAAPAPTEAAASVVAAPPVAAAAAVAEAPVAAVEAPKKADAPSDDYSETTLVDGGFLRAGQNIDTQGPPSEPPTGVHKPPAAQQAQFAAQTAAAAPSSAPQAQLAAQAAAAAPSSAPQAQLAAPQPPPAPAMAAQPRSPSAPAPAAAAFSARLAAGIAASPIQTAPPQPPAPPVLAQTAAPAPQATASEPPAFGHQALRVVVYASGNDARALTARVLAAGETAPPGSQEALLVALHPGERLL